MVGGIMEDSMFSLSIFSHQSIFCALLLEEKGKKINKNLV
jgi:hypothetical protein